ncbi:MAG: flagellar basal-body rod protein FlgG [Sulfuricurvum sp.]|nr:flagellar basal-body rod protein FlgG [Sulfuricurvum sp.]
MLSSLWIAKTGLDAQQTRMDVIANNLANANTTGFKSSRASFQDLMYQNKEQPGGQTTQQTLSPSGLMLGTGVRVVGTSKLFTQGSITQTGNSLDVAIQGSGFLQVSMPDGTTAYTRDGSLQTDANGQLVTANGYALNPPVTLPSNVQSVTIGADGTVSATTNGSTTAVQVGTLQLANFVNPAGLQSQGQNLYLETASSGSPQTGTPGSEAGAWAPCSMYIYKKKGENKIHIGYLGVDSWISSLGIKDKESTEPLYEAQSMINKILNGMN